MNILEIVTERLQGFVVHLIRFLLVSRFPFLPHQFETNETPHRVYDFIVVGSGPGGSVVASRLSETEASVLLLEKGGSAPPESAVPAVSFALMQKSSWTPFVEEPNKVAQLAYKNRASAFVTGSVMGGSTAINGLVYARGAKQDYDHWAELGNTGWDFESVLPYFMKSENFMGYPMPGAEGRHRRGGPVTVESNKLNTPLYKAFLGASKELRLNFHDGTGPNLTGIVPPYTTTRGGVRASASESFLKPVMGRPNLTVTPRANVLKVLFNNQKRAIGVVYVFKDKVRVAFARKEVILSAGALITPKLLMLSGIGPREQLQKFQIQNVATVEGVGKNLHNHPILFLSFKVRDDLPVSLLDTINPRTLQQYITTRKGPLNAPGGVEPAAYLNVDDPEWPDIGVSSSSISIAATGNNYVRSTNLKEEMFEDYFGQFAGVKSIGLSLGLLRPKSHGTVTLKSAHHDDFPVINFNSFSHPDDLKLFKKGIPKLFDFVNSQSFKKVLGITTKVKPITPCQHHPAHSDAYWECHISYFAIPHYHYTGTAKMAPPSDPLGVVNNRLSVRGVSGLRVVDASIMPQIPCTNTMAPTYMIAEKAADMIKEDWGYALDPLPRAQLCHNNVPVC